MSPLVAPSEVLKRRVSVVSSSMGRANDLIGTLLDFTESRLKAAMTIARTKTDLERVCERVVSEQVARSPGLAPDRELETHGSVRSDSLGSKGHQVSDQPRHFDSDRRDLGEFDSQRSTEALAG